MPVTIGGRRGPCDSAAWHRRAAADTAEAWQRSRAQLGKALARQQSLVPAEVVVFGGADPPGRSGRPRRDLRDWADIRAWAGRLVGLARRPDAATPA